MSERTLVPVDALETCEPTLAARLGETGADPRILEDLHSMLAGLDVGPNTIEADVQELVRTHGDSVYAELIFILSHLSFPVPAARPHWERIVEHRRKMEDRLGGAVDLRVALVSYFLEVNRKLKNPKIIEMQLFEREQASAYRDELTGLYNYRLFREHLTREVFRAHRCGRPLSLVMVDVDEFKNYNDAVGHEAGNEALTAIATYLTSALRKSDVAARYGGEEFVLILPCTPKTDAQSVAERIRSAVEQHRFAGEAALPGGKLTVSMGLATFPADADNPTDLIRHADHALYAAKAGGRNRVCIYGQSRRSFGRSDVTVPGTFRRLSDESHTLTTVNVSEAGLLFRTDARMRVGTLVELTLQTEPDREITAAGRVVHVENGGDGTYRTAVSITEATNRDRARLEALVRDSAPEDLLPDERRQVEPAS